MADADTIAPSPCVKVCTLDATKSWCTGCHRTLSEIAGWRAFTVAERQAVLRAIEVRRATWSVPDGLPRAAVHAR